MHPPRLPLLSTLPPVWQLHVVQVLLVHVDGLPLLVRQAADAYCACIRPDSAVGAAATLLQASLQHRQAGARPPSRAAKAADAVAAPRPPAAAAPAGMDAWLVADDLTDDDAYCNSDVDHDTGPASGSPRGGDTPAATAAAATGDDDGGPLGGDGGRWQQRAAAAVVGAVPSVLSSGDHPHVDWDSCRDAVPDAALDAVVGVLWAAASEQPGLGVSNAAQGAALDRCPELFACSVCLAFVDKGASADNTRCLMEVALLPRVSARCGLTKAFCH